MSRFDQPGPLAGQWVLLSYRIPREPSTPRIAVWRALKRLGVAQLGDGLVALPADARTREQLEWVAEQVTDAGGEAGIWLAVPAGPGQERELADRMAAARAEEYAAVLIDAEAAVTGSGAHQATAVRRLRGELRRIGRRDYFPPAERDHAHAAVAALAVAVHGPETGAGEDAILGTGGASAADAVAGDARRAGTDTKLEQP